MQETLHKRYQTIRRQLDEMGYTGTLNFDCVPLVEKLFKDFQRISIRYQQDSSSRGGSQSSSQIKINSSSCSRKSEDQSNIEYTLDLLNKKYCEAIQKLKQRQQEIEMLKNRDDQHGRTKQLRERYDNKMTQYVKKIQNLQKRDRESANEKKRLEESFEQLNRQLNNVKDELESKERTLFNETRERINIRKQYDDVLNTTGSIDNRRIEELNAIIERKSLRIQEMEQQQITAKARLACTKKQFEESQVERRHLLLQSKNLNCLVESLKDEIKQTNKADIALKLKMEELNRELEASKKYRMSLEKQLQNMQTSQIQRTYSNEAKDTAKEKINAMYQEVSKDLQTKRKQYNILEAQKDQLEKIVENLENKVKQLSNKNAILNKNIGSLQQEYDLINSKYSQKVKEYIELNVQKQHLQRATKELEPTKQKYIQLEAKYNQLLTSGDATSDIQMKGRRQYEHQIRVLQQQISLFKERDSQLQIKNQKLSNELQRTKIYMDNGSKQMETINSQKEALLKENNELNDKINSLQARAKSSQTQDIKKTEKMNSDEILLQDLQSKLNMQNEKVRTLLNENSLLQTNVRRQVEKNKQLYQDNVQLKSLYDNQSRNKSELLGKLNRSTSQRDQVESQKIRQSSEITHLRQKLQQSEELIEEKERAILNINHERDRYEEEFNAKLTENYELSQRIRKLEHDIKKYDQDQGENKYTCLGLQAQIKNLQSENHKLLKKGQKLEGELNNAIRNTNRFQVDIQRQGLDAGLLVASNKDLKKQLEAIENDRASLTQAMKQRTREVDQSRSLYQQIKIENEQLHHHCLNEANEIKRLSGIVCQLQSNNHQMYQFLQQRDAQIHELEHLARSSQCNQAQYISEISNYEKKLILLTNQVNLKDEDLKRAQKKDFFKSEVFGSRRQPQIDWKALMEQRLEPLQCELNIKKRQLQIQSSENQKLKVVLEKERVQNYKLTKELQDVKRYGLIPGTPIKNLMSQSCEQSELQNSSLHSNRGETDRQMKSFQSENSMSSKDIQNTFQKIRQKYSAVISQPRKY